MAESVDINLVNNEPNVDSWSLGCDIIIEEADTDIQEIRLRDIGLIGDIYTGEVPVDINPKLSNVMELDVNVTIDGVNPNIVESQIVTYENILKITDYSKETTNETGYAASARSAKTLHDTIKGIDRRVHLLETPKGDDSGEISEEKLKELIELYISDMFFWADEEHTIIGTTHSFFSEKEISANGLYLGGNEEDNETPGGDSGEAGSSTLEGLTDVSIIYPKDGDILYFNGEKWVNKELEIPADLEGYLKASDAEELYATKNALNGLQTNISTELAEYIKSIDADKKYATKDALNALSEIIDNLNVAENFFALTEDGQSIYTEYNLFSKKEISANGLSLGGGTSGGGGLIQNVLGKSSFGTVVSEDNATTFNAFAIDSLYKRIVELEGKDVEVDLSDYYTKQQTQNAITTALSPYIKTTDADGKYAALASFNALQSSFDRLYSALNDDTSGVINTWNEVVDFVNEYSGSEDLSTILGKMNTDINARVKVSDFDTWKTDVFNPLSTKVNDNTANINKILRWFNVDADGNLYTDLNFYSTKEISANGLSFGNGSGSGLISSVLSATSLGATLANDNSVVFNAYATNEIYKATQGHASRIGVLESQVGQLTTQSTKVSVSDLLTTGTKIATITVDGVAHEVKGDFLPTSGGTVEGYELPLTIKTTRTDGAYCFVLFTKYDNGQLASVGYANGVGYIANEVCGKRIGVTDNGTPVYKLGYAATDTEYTLIHSGNFSDIIGDYYINHNGGVITGDPACLTLRVPRSGADAWLQFTDAETSDSYAIGMRRPADLFGLQCRINDDYYNILHSGNVGEYALPLTGGLMKDAATIQWGNNKCSWDDVVNGFIGISNASEEASLGYYAGLSFKGHYGLQLRSFAGSNLEFRGHNAANWGNWKTIAFTDSDITGNAGSADVLASSYANQSINFGPEGKVRMIYCTNVDAPSLGYPWTYSSGLSVVTNYTGWQMVTYGGPQLPNPFFRKLFNGDTWSDWKELAFLDDNVASATKLQTARTIWGQSFDGTANIDTTTYGMMRWLYFSNSSGVEQGYVGRGSDTNDIYLAVYGENSLRFRTNSVTRATITPNGNVLIGTTTDSGYKLDINGDMLVTGGIKTNDIHGNGNALYLGNAGNSSYIYIREDMSATSGYWSINMAGNAVFAGTLTVSGKATLNGGIETTTINASGNVRTDGALGVVGTATFLGATTHDGGILAGANVRPSVNLGANLGTSSYRWNAIYGYSANLSGGLTVSGASSLYILTTSGNATIGGALTASSTLTVNGNLTASSNLTVSGNIWASGEISANALNQGSDIRFKHQLGDIALDLDTIANAPMFRFTWTNKENSRVYIGSSAQYWKDSARELVSVDKDDFHRLDYATLGVLIGVTLGKTVKNHEDRIKELEREVVELKEENRRLRYEHY